MTGLTIPGVDYAWTEKHYDGLKKTGVKFVMRYISKDKSKDLSADELAELRRRGISVGLVFETVAQRALAGRDGGEEDAKYADRRVKELALAGLPIYFAADWDVTPRQKPTVWRYIRGAASVIGKQRTGVYGGYWIVKYLAEQDACDWFWQTYAWSGGYVHPRANVYQYKNGVTLAHMSVDLNRGATHGCGVYPELPHNGGHVPTPEEIARWVQFSDVLERIHKSHPDLRKRTLSDVRSYYRSLLKETPTREKVGA